MLPIFLKGQLLLGLAMHEIYERCNTTTTLNIIYFLHFTHQYNLVLHVKSFKLMPTTLI